MSLLLVRHTTPRVEPGCCYGRLDVPLEADAPLEIATTLRSLPPVTQVIASPARRCVPLAAALAARDGLEVRYTEDLAELDFGRWEGLRWDDIDRAAIDAWANDPWGYAPGGGETLAAMWARIERLAAALPPPPAPVALIGHHGSLRVLLMQILGRSWREMFDYKLDFGAAWQVRRDDFAVIPCRAAAVH